MVIAILGTGMESIGIQMEIFMTDHGLVEINREKDYFYMQVETGLKVKPVVEAFYDYYFIFNILLLSICHQIQI